MFFCITQAVIAQQQPLFTLYREQTGLLNPAMPGLNHIVSDLNNTISATYRNQWVIVPGAPTNQILNWETILDDKNLIVGAYLIQDKLGNAQKDLGEIKTTNAYLRLAYKIVFDESDKKFLSIGFNAGGSRYRTVLSTVAVAQGIVGLHDKTKIIPDLSMGVFYNHGNLFYAGVSAPQLLGNSLLLDGENSKTFALKRTRHIYGVAGFYIDAPFLGNDEAFLEPNMWIMYVPPTLSSSQILAINLNIRAKISQAFWTGLGYNSFAQTVNIETGSVLGESIGLSNGQLKIGFGFSVPVGIYWSGFGLGGDVFLSYSWSK